jgi:hypothetical protein
MELIGTYLQINRERNAEECKRAGTWESKGLIINPQPLPHSRKVYDYYNQLTTFKSKSFNQGSMSEGYIFCQSRQELTPSPNHIANTYAQQT